MNINSLLNPFLIARRSDFQKKKKKIVCILKEKAAVKNKSNLLKSLVFWDNSYPFFDN